MSNLATKILDEIQQELKVDAQWLNRRSNSLTLVADKLEQTFSVSEPFDYLDKEAVVVESRIPIARNVGRPGEQVCGLLSQFNYTNIGSAYVFDPEKKEVFSTLKIAVTEAELGQRCWQTRIFAMFQLIMAEHQAVHIANPISGEVAHAAPTRPQPDPMMNSFMQFITSRPRAENRFESPELFEQAEEYCKKIGGVSNESGPPELSLEFRFSDSSTTAASLVTNFEHPTFGRGLRTFLALPISYKTNAEASLQANILNLREVAGTENGDFLGAWCIDQRTENLSPVFSSYLPNSLFAESWMAKVVVQLGLRARNCERWWFPDTPFSKTTLEVIMGRKGQVHEGGDTPH
jgi:hypothetical protein